MINKLINLLGIKGILLLTFLEYSCFPIPSEVVLPILGYEGNVRGYFLPVLILSIIVSLIASSILYLVGYYGGSVLLDKIYNKFKSSQKGIDVCKKFICKHTKFSLVISRMIPLSRTYISLVAGSLKCKYYTYLFCSSVGIGIWNTILVGTGYIFFDNLDIVTKLYDKYKILILILFNVSIILLLIKKFKAKKR